MNKHIQDTDDITCYTGIGEFQFDTTEYAVSPEWAREKENAKETISHNPDRSAIRVHELESEFLFPGAQPKTDHYLGDCKCFQYFPALQVPGPRSDN